MDPASEAADDPTHELANLALIAAEVGRALTERGGPREVMQRCVETIVGHLDAAFARVWILNEADDVLELKASAGLYTHIDGPHARVPVGKFKIGMIARERRPHLTNQVVGDPRVGDQGWARREGMVSFAGHPLIVRGEVLGVFALFSRRRLSTEVLDALRTVADILAVGLDHFRIESRLVAAREAAEAATRAKSDFLATMSHEIRTPMNAILNMTALTLETGLDARQRRYLDVVHASGRHLLSLINDILDFSKIEADRLDVESIPFRLRELLEEVTEAFRPRVIEQHVELIVHVLPDVPDALEGDPTRVRQVLTNLVGNAFKFTEAGEVAVRVSRAGGDDDAGGVSLLFEVRDTGQGIPAEQRGRLFRPFTQADSSTSRKHGGTGLGLAISRRLAAMMGGDLTFTSEVGVGSTFSFTARLGRRHDAGPGRPELPEAARRRRALIVEDNETNAELLAAYFAGFRIPCDIVPSAEAAFDLLDRRGAPGSGEPYGLVLLDWLLPGMNGLAAAARLRGRDETRSVPIIMISAYAGREEEARCAEAGVSVFLPKPITQSTLFDAILEAEGLAPASPRRGGPEAPIDREFAGARVLVAEDNEINQLVARELLGRLGVEIEVAADGRAAIEWARRGGFDAILMDMQMPEMDGPTATRLIRRDPALRALPIIALTANAMASDAEACLAAGMDDFVSKPIDVAALARALRRWLPPREAGRGGDPAPGAADGGDPPAPPRLEGIAVDDAIRRLGLPIAAIGPMLVKFADGHRRTLVDLAAAVAAGESDVVRRLAHSVAGAAGNLGAVDLHHAAARLERAATAGGDGLDERLRDVEAASEVAFKSIDRLRESAAPRPGAGASEADRAIEPARLRVLLDRLSEALADSDPAATDEVLSRLESASLAPDLRAGLGSIRALVDGYDFESASEALGPLLARQKGPARP